MAVVTFRKTAVVRINAASVASVCCSSRFCCAKRMTKSVTQNQRGDRPAPW